MGCLCVVSRPTKFVEVKPFNFLNRNMFVLQVNIVLLKKNKIKKIIRVHSWI